MKKVKYSKFIDYIILKKIIENSDLTCNGSDDLDLDSALYAMSKTILLSKVKGSFKKNAKGFNFTANEDCFSQIRSLIIENNDIANLDSICLLQNEISLIGVIPYTFTVSILTYDQTYNSDKYLSNSLVNCIYKFEEIKKMYETKYSSLRQELDNRIVEINIEKEKQRLLEIEKENRRRDREERIRQLSQNSSNPISSRLSELLNRT